MNSLKDANTYKDIEDEYAGVSCFLISTLILPIIGISGSFYLLMKIFLPYGEYEKVTEDKIADELIYEYVESSDTPLVLFNTEPEGYEIYSIEPTVNDEGETEYKIGYINSKSIEYDINISKDKPIVLRKVINSN